MEHLTRLLRLPLPEACGFCLKDRSECKCIEDVNGTGDADQ